MLELKGFLKYKTPPETRWGESIHHEKALLIVYPEDKGIIQEDEHFIITNTYLFEKTLQEMFFGVNMEIELKNLYHYELEKDILYTLDIHLKSHKDVGKFMRKNKIKNFLEANRNDA